MSVDALQIGGAQRTKSAAEAWWVFPAVPLLAAAVAFAWTLHGDLQRLYGMTSEAWDLAYDQQVIWNISQGQGFYSSFARANFLGIHLEPIFVVLAAVEKLWPSPTVLLIFSSAGLAATAPAAYLFFRAILPAERVESPWLAVALSAPIPFWAALQEAARDFFHPENMALSFALLAAWAGIRGRRVAMWSFCVLDLSCKEDQVYTVAMIAILMSAYGAPAVKKHWRVVLFLAVAWLLVGGGTDLDFHRDEYEIAQWHAVFGTPLMAQPRVHTDLLLPAGEKIAKSLARGTGKCERLAGSLARQLWHAMRLPHQHQRNDLSG